MNRTAMTMILSLILAACAGRSPAPEPGDGVIGVSNVRSNEYAVIAPDGISEITLVRAAGTETKLDYVKHRSAPYLAIEGVEVVDTETGRALDVDQLRADGVIRTDGNQLRVEPTEDVSWRIKVIDHYRK